jgi:hypothetical protein
MRPSVRRDCWTRLIRQDDVLQRLDANEGAAFARELTAIDALLYEVEYLQTDAMELLPIKSDIPDGIKEHGYQTVDRVGEARRVRGDADDYPRVDVVGAEFLHKIAEYGDSYEYSIIDIRAAVFMKIKVEPQRALTAQDAIRRKIDRCLWLGDAEAGTQGFANNAEVDDNIISVTNKNWDTEQDGLKILNDLLEIEKKYLVDTNYAETPTDLALSVEAYAKIATMPVSTLNPMLTVLAAFKANSQFVKGVHKSPRLALADAQGDGPRHIIWNNKPEKLQGIVPVEFEMSPPVSLGFKWYVNCRATCGGVVIRYPKSVRYVDGTFDA